MFQNQAYYAQNYALNCAWRIKIYWILVILVLVVRYMHMYIFAYGILHY